MLKSYFLSKIQLLLLLNVLVKPIWIFFIDKNVQLTVGQNDYGLYNALVSLTVIFNILLDFGITNFNNKSIAEDFSKLKSVLPNLLITKMALSVLYFITVICAAYLFNYDTRALKIVSLLAIVQFLNSYLQFLRSNISANHDFVLDGVFSVLDKVIMILICSVLLYSSYYKTIFQIEWFIYAQIVAYSLVTVSAFFVVIKKYTLIDFTEISFTEIKSLFKQSVPYAILILFMGIYMRSDTLMLERLESATQNGMYAFANRLLDVSNMIGFLFAGILLPMFSRLLIKNGNINEIIVSSVNVLLPISLSLVAFSVVYSNEIMFLLYYDKTNELAWIFRMVIASFPAYCIMYVYSTLLTANGDIKLLIFFAVLASIFSIALNFYLIQEYKALGAAITAFIVEWLLAIVFILACVYKFKLPINKIWLMKFGILFFSILGINLLLKSYQFSLLLSVIFNAISFVVMVYSLKFWDKKRILLLLNKN